MGSAESFENVLPDDWVFYSSFICFSNLYYILDVLFGAKTQQALRLWKIIISFSVALPEWTFMRQFCWRRRCFYRSYYMKSGNRLVLSEFLARWQKNCFSGGRKGNSQGTYLDCIYRGRRAQTNHFMPWSRCLSFLVTWCPENWLCAPRENFCDSFYWRRASGSKYRNGCKNRQHCLVAWWKKDSFWRAKGLGLRSFPDGRLPAFSKQRHPVR